MAVDTITTDVNLRLTLLGGIDEKGKSITRNKVYRYVKLDAAPEGVHAAGMALASLQTYELIALNMVTAVDLSEA